MPYLSDPLFANLIRQLPVAEHSIPVPAEFWAPLCAASDCAHLHQAIFAGAGQVRITRRWLRSAVVSDELRALAILLWGYPTGARKARHKIWLKNLPAIARAAAAPGGDWPSYYDRLHGLGELGVSTITKFATFFGHRFGAQSLEALSLDQRILSVLKAARWAELSSLADLNYPQAARRYPDYLEQLHVAAAQISASAEQIEFFLFVHGDQF